MEKKLYEQMTELVNWLNDECPAVAPPLEPYTTADLSHSFAESLRIRLDEINVIRSAMANKPYTAVSGSLPLASAEFIKWLMDDKHDYVYVNGEFIEQWTNVEFTISELYDQWSMERRQANDR